MEQKNKIHILKFGFGFGKGMHSKKYFMAFT